MRLIAWEAVAAVLVLPVVSTQEHRPFDRRQQQPPRGATQSVWGQCGGRAYTGATACPTGNYCRFDGNEWYQQCVPNGYPEDQDPGAPPPQQPGGGVVTRTLTTVITVGGPRPTVVRTMITYLQPSTTARPTGDSKTTIITLVPDEPFTWRV